MERGETTIMHQESLNIYCFTSYGILENCEWGWSYHAYKGLGDILNNRGTNLQEKWASRYHETHTQGLFTERFRELYLSGSYHT